MTVTIGTATSNKCG